MPTHAPSCGSLADTVTGVFGLVLAAGYLPPLRDLFGTQPVAVTDQLSINYNRRRGL